MTQRLAVVLAIAVLAFASACSHIQLIADYDEATLEDSIRVAQRVDVFYGTLLELEPEGRTYSPFADDWVEIGAEIGTLVHRNASRPLNEESLQISQDILAFWRAYQEKHREKDAYPDARFDRRRFERLFRAAVSAEAAKQRSTDDREPPAEDGS
ncbi:MAG: hypothetical protein ACRDGR_07065 [bacterium]